jgi:hypothetical protein
MEEFAETVAACSPHIQELHIDISAFLSESSIFDIFQGPAPELESLTIASQRIPPADSVLPKLFDGHTPKLSRLNLEYFTSWPENDFTDLTHLCLNNQHNNGGLTLSQFLDFIETCPRLQELLVADAGPVVDDMPPHASPRRLIALDHLRELTIGKWNDAPVISAFLSHLIIPHGARMYLWSGRPEYMLPSDCSNLRNMETISEVRFLRVEREYSMILLVDGVMCIHENCEPEELLTVISRALPLDALERIWVQDVTTSSPFTKEDWRLIFTQLPSLQQLGIGGDTSQPVLSALRSRESVGTTEFPICRYLEDLSIAVDHNQPTLFVCAFTAERAAQQSSLRTLTVTQPDYNSREWSTPIFTSYGWGTWGTPNDRRRRRRSWTPDSVVGGRRPFSQYDMTEDLQYLNNHVQLVKQDPMKPTVEVMLPSWPTHAFNWVMRTRTRWT